MRLKRLTLHGYKTFATKTAFEFTNGITAVIGPNGSGKSNIADALRWVLGEQSFSTLRGKRTADMIFTGSQQRARAGMAQAILTLDNSTGWLPIDYSEIEIGRRAYRSGENEYLINGQKVRLRDVSELLSSSGLAHRTYTIIGQGLVDQALSLRADERRSLFEEAAGISLYKSRRAETLRRLDETNRNLERLHDILSEIRPRLTSLKRQANRAQNYEQVAADLRHHLRIWYGYKWLKAKQELRHNRFESEQLKSEWESERSKTLNLQEEIQEQRLLAGKLQKEVESTNILQEDVRIKLDDSRRLVAVLRERKSALWQQLVDLGEEIPRLEQQQNIALSELDQAVIELTNVQNEFQENEKAWRQFKLTIKVTQEQIETKKNQLNNLEFERDKLRSDNAKAEGILDQLQQRRRESEDLLSDNAHLNQITADIERHIESLEADNKQLRQLNNEIAIIDQKRSGLSKEYSIHRSNIESLEKENALIRDGIAALQARHDLMEEMRLDAQPEIESGQNIIPFIDTVQIEERYQRAIDSALRHRLSAYLVSDVQSMWSFLDLNASEWLVTGVAGKLNVPGPLQTPSGSGVIDWADNLVKSSSESRDLARLLLGRVLIVQSREDAYTIVDELPPGSLAASLDGFVVHSGGLVESNPLKSEANILAVQEELQVTAAQLADSQLLLYEKTNELELLQEQAAKVQTALDGLDIAEETLSKQIVELNQKIGRSQRAIDLSQQKQQMLQEQRHASKAELQKNLKHIATLEASLVEDKVTLQEKSQLIEIAKQQLVSLPVTETEDQKRQLMQKADAARTILAGRQAVVDSRRATLTQIENLLQRRTERQAELKNAWQALQLKDEESNLKKLQSEFSALETTLSPLKEQVVNNRTKLAQLEKQLDRIQRSSHELETQYTQARIELNRSENQIEALQERITVDLGLVNLRYDDDQAGQSPLPIAEVVEQLPDVEVLPEDIEETIQRYRGQLNRMGGFNPDAPAEYDETKERYEYLGQQIEDLAETQTKLSRVIDELDDQTSLAFAAIVEEVDALFGDVFKRLFGGGSAQLVLTDPDDLINSGVDIVARLPRRREQGLALLSGGERSLTAVALIFALLKVSPTPFCVLDEVDAMLDDANVTRFRDLLRELSEQTQFILITHNRGTVQVAESVYGVSMGADSVSQVVSIRPEDYVNHFDE